MPATQYLTTRAGQHLCALLMMASSIFDAKQRTSKPLSALAVRTGRHREIKHPRPKMFGAKHVSIFATDWWSYDFFIADRKSTIQGDRSLIGLLPSFVMLKVKLDYLQRYEGTNYCTTCAIYMANSRDVDVWNPVRLYLRSLPSFSTVYIVYLRTFVRGLITFVWW